MEHDVTHEQLHNKLEEVQSHFNEKHSTLIKWLVSAILTIVALTMTQIVSVAATLAEVDGTQELVLQSLDRIDRKLEATDRRIQEESQEAESDLKDHRREAH